MVEELESGAPPTYITNTITNTDPDPSTSQVLTATVTSLQPHTRYEFRVRAANAHGKTQGSETSHLDLKFQRHYQN